MSDPVLSIIILVSLFGAIAAARYFNTVDDAFGSAAVTPFLSGAVCGVVILTLPATSLRTSGSWRRECS